jgi:hypothetical protein
MLVDLPLMATGAYCASLTATYSYYLEATMARLKTIRSKLTAMPKALPSAINSSSWRGKDSSSTARGYDYRWQRYREQFLMQHPLCLYCEREGRTTAATVVDHIVPHQGQQSVFWALDNHQSLCAACHSGTKAKEEAAAGYR